MCVMERTGKGWQALVEGRQLYVGGAAGVNDTLRTILAEEEEIHVADWYDYFQYSLIYRIPLLLYILCVPPTTSPNAPPCRHSDHPHHVVAARRLPRAKLAVKERGLQLYTSPWILRGDILHSIKLKGLLSHSFNGSVWDVAWQPPLSFIMVYLCCSTPCRWLAKECFFLNSSGSWLIHILCTCYQMHANSIHGLHPFVNPSKFSLLVVVGKCTGRGSFNL